MVSHLPFQTSVPLLSHQHVKALSQLSNLLQPGLLDLNIWSLCLTEPFQLSTMPLRMLKLPMLILRLIVKAKASILLAKQPTLALHRIQLLPLFKVLERDISIWSIIMPKLSLLKQVVNNFMLTQLLLHVKLTKLLLLKLTLPSNYHSLWRKFINILMMLNKDSLMLRVKSKKLFNILNILSNKLVIMKPLLWLL